MNLKTPSRLCIILLCFNIIYAEELTIIMGGDALLHSSVYKDAQSECDEALQDFSYRVSKVLEKDSISKANYPHAKDIESKKQDSHKCYDFSKMLSMIKPYIAKYDLAFYNQETILGGKELGLSSYPQFNSPQEFGDSMIDSGFNLVSLANNHTLDRGQRAVLESTRFWLDKESVGVMSAGSYASKQSRDELRIGKKNGITYALLAYTYGTNGIKMPKGKEYLVNVYSKKMMADDIATLRNKVNLLIVSMHWGVEYEFEPTKEQQDLARFLSERGVDIVIGNHPHVIQPIEMINNTLVIYSLGNLLSAQKGMERKIGAFVSVRVVKQKTKDSKSSKSKSRSKLHAIALKNIKADLIYTYHNTQRRDFRIYPFISLNNTILPDYSNIYNNYIAILKQKDSSNKIKIGIFDRF